MSSYEKKRTACSGEERVSKMGLLAMLGGGKQPKKTMYSVSDQKYWEILSLMDKNGYDLDIVSSILGITKSSLKTRLVNPPKSVAAYNETSPNSISRKYLEKNFDSWTVSSFDAKKMEACIDMTNNSGTVHLSVKVPAQTTSRI